MQTYVLVVLCCIQRASSSNRFDGMLRAYDSSNFGDDIKR
jgi:hypothetical protein